MSVALARKRLSQRIRHLEDRMGDVSTEGPPRSVERSEAPHFALGELLNLREQLSVLRTETAQKEIKLKETLSRLKESEDKSHLEEVLRMKEEELRGVLQDMAARETELQVMLKSRQKGWEGIKDQLNSQIQTLEEEKKVLLAGQQQLGQENEQDKMGTEEKFVQLRKEKELRESQIADLKSELSLIHSKAEKNVLEEKYKLDKERSREISLRDEEIVRLQAQAEGAKTDVERKLLEEKMRWSHERSELVSVRQSLLEKIKYLSDELLGMKEAVQNERDERLMKEDEVRQAGVSNDSKMDKFTQKLSEREDEIRRLHQNTTILQSRVKELEARPPVKEVVTDDRMRKELELTLAHKEKTLQEKDDRVRELEKEKQELESKMLLLLMDSQSLERLEKGLTSVSEFAQNVGEGGLNPPVPKPPRHEEKELKSVVGLVVQGGTPRPPSTQKEKERKSGKEKKGSMWTRFVGLFSPTAVSVRVRKL